jgi:2-polyprenyl-3-methyl-5-hydroxy-6-metoxy-1,4-benzoquinol methylase
MHKDWVTELFVQRSDLFLRLLNQKWLGTEELVNGMIKVLDGFEIRSGDLLDLCCGNGRVSVYMAKKGFRSTGIDLSKAFLEDARKKARKHGVSDLVTFLEGDVRKLKEVVNQKNSKPFDVIISAWTSIGFYKEEDDLSIFQQARELSRKDAILFVAETMHTEYLSIKFTPTSYAELDHIVMLENRKYDPITSQANTSWIFYNKRAQDLKFIDKVESTQHVYSLSELSSLLRKAGWEAIAAYGNLSTLQPMSPLTHMNIVARAV